MQQLYTFKMYMVFAWFERQINTYIQKYTYLFLHLILFTN